MYIKAPFFDAGTGPPVPLAGRGRRRLAAPKGPRSYLPPAAQRRRPGAAHQELFSAAFSPTAGSPGRQLQRPRLLKIPAACGASPAPSLRSPEGRCRNPFPRVRGTNQGAGAHRPGTAGGNRVLFRTRFLPLCAYAALSHAAHSGAKVRPSARKSLYLPEAGTFSPAGGVSFL